MAEEKAWHDAIFAHKKGPLFMYAFSRQNLVLF